MSSFLSFLFIFICRDIQNSCGTQQKLPTPNGKRRHEHNPLLCHSRTHPHGGRNRRQLHQTLHHKLHHNLPGPNHRRPLHRHPNHRPLLHGGPSLLHRTQRLLRQHHHHSPTPIQTPKRQRHGLSFRSTAATPSPTLLQRHKLGFQLHNKTQKLGQQRPPSQRPFEDLN